MISFSTEDLVSRQSCRAVWIMSRQQNDRFLSGESPDTLQGQKRHRGVVGDAVHLLGLQKVFGVSCIAGNKVRHAFCPDNDRKMANRVSWSGDKEDALVLRNG